jgi:hypothetical protein
MVDLVIVLEILVLADVPAILPLVDVLVMK